MSFQIRKYYADEAVAAPAGPPNIAELMAKQGITTTADTTDDIPNITIEETTLIKEGGATPPATEPEKKSAETASTPAAPAKTDTPATPSQATPASQPVVVDWKEELKKADQAEILKELGFDDKMVGFFNKWRTDGNITDYIRAVSVDFAKMSPEQLMKYQLEQAYPEFSPEDMEELYQATLDKYKLNPEIYSETEVKRGKVLIQADAKKVREELTTRQQEYILSAKPPAPTVDNTAQVREAELNELRGRYTASLTGAQATKDLLSNKTLTVGSGDTAFKYEIADPQSILNILQQPEQYARHVFQEDGSPIADKQLFIGAAAIDHVGLSNEIFKAGMAAGAKKAIEQIENAKKPEAETSKGDTTPTDPAAALAKFGVLTQG